MGISYGRWAMVWSLVATLHFTTTGSTASPSNTLSDKPQPPTHGLGLFQNVAIYKSHGFTQKIGIVK